MAIASNVSLVTLKGQYVDYAGNAIAGQIKFTLSNATRNQIADQIVIPSTVSATFDSTGSFSTLLPATNDPALVDAFTYQVEESFSNGRSYSISLPVAAPNDRTNLLPNPSMETNITGWQQPSNTTLAQSSAQAFLGTNSLSLTSIAAGDIAARWSYGTGGIPVTAGNTYTWSMYVRSATVSRNAYALVLWMNGNTYLSGNGGTISATSTSGWTRFSVTAVAPSTANYVNPQILIQSTGAAGEVHYIDAGLFELSSTLEDYFDGSTDGINGTASWTGTANASTSFLDRDVRTNLCYNPSFETNLNGWTAYNTSTRTRVTNQSAPFGTTALSVDVANNTNGAIFMPSTVAPSGTTVAISAYVKGTAGKTLHFSGRPQSAADAYLTEGLGTQNITFTGDWQRISTTYSYTGVSFKPGIQFYTTTAGADTFYIDGVLIETGSTIGTYFDGSSTYGSWTGTANGSTSKITRNLFDISELAPAGTFPPFFAFAANSAWIVLDASVQTMDTKIDQSRTAFLKATPTYDWLYYRTYAEVASFGTYADVVNNIFFYADDLARGNLITNPSFETNTATWGTIGASSAVRSTAQSAFDSASLLLTSNATTSLGPYNTGASGRIPVTAGHTYTFSIFVRDVNTAVNYRAGIEFYNSLTAGTNLGTTYGTTTAVTSADWTRLSVTVTAPVGALGAVPICYSLTTPSNGTQAYFDGALFEKSATLGTYIEGDSWVVRHQTQATNALASNSSATVQLGIITAAYAERIDEFMMVGA